MMHDSRGTEIEIGQRVAYNCSGSVVSGEVVDVQHGHVKINVDSGYAYPKAPHISKVKHGYCVLVLKHPTRCCDGTGVRFDGGPCECEQQKFLLRLP